MKNTIIVRWAWRLFLTFCTLLSALAPSLVQAAREFDPALEWQTIETPHFELHYPVGLETVAFKLASQAEPIHDKLSAYFSWIPREKTQVVIADQWDSLNGSATPVPFNQILLHVTPSSDIDSLEDFDDSLARVFQHEYAHVLHLDKAEGFPENLRHIIGRFAPSFPLLFPNVFEPAWLIEGIATYLETDQERGVGRGQSTYFRSLMRNEVAHGIKSLNGLNQPLVSWPGGAARYVYGVYFFNFLHDRYGDAYIQGFVQSYSENFIPFFLNSAARRTFEKKNFYALWTEFEAYLHQQFDSEIANATQQGLREGVALTSLGNYTGRSRVDAEGTVFYLRADGQRPSALVRLDRASNEHRPITTVHGGGQFDWHADGGVLLVQPEMNANTNSYNDLYQVNIGTGIATRLTRAGRYAYATWSPDGNQIAAVKVSAGQHRLELMKANGQSMETLWQDESVLISHIDWAPDGQTLVASLRRNSQWNLELFDIAQRQWRPLTQGAAFKAQPQFSPDGNSVVYSSDENGIYNIYQISIATRESHQITNVVGGAFYPSLSPDGRALFYSGLNGQGYDLYTLLISQPDRLTTHREQLPNTAHETPAFATRDDVSAARTYNGLSRLAPTWWLPSIGFAPDSTLVSLVTSGNDPLSWHSYAIQIGAETKYDTSYWSMNYSYDRWFPTLSLFLTRTNSTILFKETSILANIETQDSITAIAQFPFISTSKQAEIYVGSVHNNYRQKYRHGLFPAIADSSDIQVLAGMKFNSTQRLPKAVFRQAGWQAQGSFDSNLGDSDFPGDAIAGKASYFTPVFWHSVAAINALAAVASDSAKPYRLGFDTEQIFDPIGSGGSLLAGRRSFDLHGYPSGLPNLRGNNLQFGSIDWHFPLGWVETGLMAPPIGINRAKGNIFTEAARIWRNKDGSARDTWYRSVGAEIAAEITLGYRYQIEATAGISKGLDQFGELQSYFRFAFRI